MLQLYFLSIVINGLAGFLFVFGDFGGNESAEGDKKFSFFGDGFRLVVGILASVIGILKLFAPSRKLLDLVGETPEKLPRSIPILGDLLPALAGLAAGFILIYGFYRKHSAIVDAEEKINSFGDTFLQYKKAVGIVILIIALLHFFFYGALFL
jgi:hypothetical protein